MKIDGHMPPQPVNTARLAGGSAQRPTPARDANAQAAPQERVEISAKARELLKTAQPTPQPSPVRKPTGAEAPQAVQGGTGPSKAAQPAAKKA